MKNTPNQIYLQVGEDCPKNHDFTDLCGVSWCAEKINDNDLEYVRVTHQNNLRTANWVLGGMSILLALTVAITAQGWMQEHSKRTSLQQEVVVIATDYHHCMQSNEKLQQQVNASRNHMEVCSFISREQIINIQGDQGHWLQLALDGPGYSLLTP